MATMTISNPPQISDSEYTKLYEEFKEIERYFQYLENDQDWQVIIEKLKRLLELCELGLFTKSQSVKKLENLTCINNYIITERTQLMSETLIFVNELDSLLKDQFTPFLIQYLPNLIKNLGRTNKIFVKKTIQCIEKLIKSTQNYDLFLPQFLAVIKESINKGQRIAVSEIVVNISGDLPDAKLQELENFVQASIEDSSLEVRNLSKKLFDLYSKRVDEERRTTFVNSLSDIAKKTLKLAPAGATKPSGLKSSIAELKKQKRQEQLNQLNDGLDQLNVS